MFIVPYGNRGRVGVAGRWTGPMKKETVASKGPESEPRKTPS